MTRFEIVLAVNADDQADVRDLADEILLGVRAALLKGRHKGIRLDAGISVAQPVTRLPVRARVVLPHTPGTGAA